MASISYEGNLVGFDITVPVAMAGTRADLDKRLRSVAKKFVYQLEDTSTGDFAGFRHYQIRLHLIKRSTCYNLLQLIIPACPGHWSVTSADTHACNTFNYVMKVDTRVEGPWTEKDTNPDPPPMTRQLALFNKLQFFLWQVHVLCMCHELDDRTIKVIYDPFGDSGKSIFAEYLEYHGYAFELPPLKSIEDIMQFCFSFPTAATYLIDMPRSMKKDKLGEFYAGLETLKNGVVYDTRYCGKKKRFDRPQVIVFTNILPEFSMLSTGRWEVYRMTLEKDLELIDIATPSNL